jgi:hypothetical protein
MVKFGAAVKFCETSLTVKKKVVHVVTRQVALCWGNPRIALANPGAQSVHGGLRVQSTGSRV